MTLPAPRRPAIDVTAEPLVATKLYLPRRRRDLVARPQLLALLARAADVPLVLVDAPPGWGKTTLLAQWAAERDDAVGWVSLDLHDNDPTRFWTYLLAAL